MSMRQAVLEALRRADGWISGEDLSGRLGVTRAAVWKHVQALEARGWQIEAQRSRGYRLGAAPEAIAAEALEGLLGTSRIGRSVIVHDVTGSTNSDALEASRQGAADGTVVMAEEQTAGRGRLGRTWESARSVNLYCSLLLRPEIVPAAAPQLSLVAGVAVCEALEEEVGAEAGASEGPRIKWPNDVVVGGRRKMAGILTEIEAEADRVRGIVVGIGVNLNSRREHFPEELHDRATSAFLETGRSVDRTAFAARLLTRFEHHYERFLVGGFAAVREGWETRSALSGRRVEIGGAGRDMAGICLGIDDEGALLLDTGAEKPERVLAGDVTVLGGYQ